MIIGLFLGLLSFISELAAFCFSLFFLFGQNERGGTVVGCEDLLVCVFSSRRLLTAVGYHTL